MNLPDVCKYTKPELLRLLEREEYGIMPPKALAVRGERVKSESFCAGKAKLDKIILTCETENGSFSFPVYFTCPTTEGRHPCFVHIAFRDSVPDRYMPSEELVDGGFAVLSFCYKDVTDDSADFSDGLAGVIFPEGRKNPDDCGQLALWAWAAMRVMDYAVTLPELDKDCISVCGHSRLGKTALLAGAEDERFFCAFSNDSGSSGASLARDKTADSEHISDIVRSFSYWFCDNYKKYADNEDEMPFDQHFLLAANWPHSVYVAGAEGDLWADPQNEYRACTAADSFYRRMGAEGFVSSKARAEACDSFGEGFIGYHMRRGTHYFSREDWQRYMDYVRRHRK